MALRSADAVRPGQVVIHASFVEVSIFPVFSLVYYFSNQLIDAFNLCVAYVDPERERVAPLPISSSVYSHPCAKACHGFSAEVIGPPGQVLSRVGNSFKQGNIQTVVLRAHTGEYRKGEDGHSIHLVSLLRDCKMWKILLVQASIVFLAQVEGDPSVEILTEELGTGGENVSFKFRCQHSHGDSVRWSFDSPATVLAYYLEGKKISGVFMRTEGEVTVFCSVLVPPFRYRSPGVTIVFSGRKLAQCLFHPRSLGGQEYVMNFSRSEGVSNIIGGNLQVPSLPKIWVQVLSFSGEEVFMTCRTEGEFEYTHWKIEGQYEARTHFLSNSIRVLCGCFQKTYPSHGPSGFPTCRMKVSCYGQARTGFYSSPELLVDSYYVVGKKRWLTHKSEL